MLCSGENDLSKALQVYYKLYRGQNRPYETLQAFYALCSGENELFDPLQTSYTLLRCLKRILHSSASLLDAFQWVELTLQCSSSHLHALL